MYNIYTDKNELFEAKIELEGASLTETSARLLVETNKWDLIFQGQIDNSGNVSIPIKKLKSIFTEDVKGMLKLEIVADDTFFVPWEDEFSLSRSKSVVVSEVKNKNKEVIKESTPKVSVKQTPQHPTNTNKIEEKKVFNSVRELSKSYLREIMIAEKELQEGVDLKTEIRNITDNFIKEYNLKPHNEVKKELYKIVRDWNIKRV